MLAYPLLRETVPASAQSPFPFLRGQHGVVHSVIHRKSTGTVEICAVSGDAYPFLRLKQPKFACAGPKRTCFCVPIGKLLAFMRTQFCARLNNVCSWGPRINAICKEASTRFKSSMSNSCVPVSAERWVVAVSMHSLPNCHSCQEAELSSLKLERARSDAGRLSRRRPARPYLFLRAKTLIRQRLGLHGSTVGEPVSADSSAETGSLSHAVEELPFRRNRYAQPARSPQKRVRPACIGEWAAPQKQVRRLFRIDAETGSHRPQLQMRLAAETGTPGH